MIYFVVSLILTLGSTLANWQPVPPHSQLYNTGDCITQNGGDAFWWTAPEQCFDGEQQLAKATIGHDTKRDAGRGQRSITLHIAGQFTKFKIWVSGQLVGEYIARDDLIVVLPLGETVLQAIADNGSPAEIFSIS
jgi:hypothetical protein